jgi:hypothetical protein
MISKKVKRTKQFSANRRLLTQKSPINSASEEGNGNPSTIIEWKHLDRHGPRPQSNIGHLPEPSLFSFYTTFNDEFLRKSGRGNTNSLPLCWRCWRANPPPRRRMSPCSPRSLFTKAFLLESLQAKVSFLIS